MSCFYWKIENIINNAKDYINYIINFVLSLLIGWTIVGVKFRDIPYLGRAFILSGVGLQYRWASL